jgi:hypothetical protein
MSHQARMRLAAIAIMVFCVAGASSLAAPADSDKLTLIGEPKLIVGPDCPGCDEGVLDIYFRNDDKRPVPLLITVDKNLEDAFGKPTEAHFSRVLINPKTSRVYGEEKEIAVEPNGMLLVRVTVANVHEDGEWKAKIYNRGKEMATFKVYRIHPPFNVKIDGAKPDQPELTFEMRAYRKEGVLRIPLHNEDSRSYLLKLEFLVKGLPASATEMPLYLPSKGSIVAEIKFPDEKATWFNQRWQGKFKDETADGQLILTQLAAQAPKPSAVPAPATPSAPGTPPAAVAGAEAPKAKPPLADSASKVIPVKVHLKYYNQPQQYFWIGLVLLFGALCSLILNAYLPNQAQRSDLKKKLEALRARIRGLPLKLASRVRVSLGLEAKQCDDLLGKGVVINPRFSEVIAALNPRVERLTERLDLAEQLGSLRMRFDAQREHWLFPTPMTLVRREFEQADDLVRQLEFNQSFQTQAETIVKSLSTHIDNLENADKFYANQHDQVEQIAGRVRMLLLDKPDTPPAAGHHWPHVGAEPVGKALYVEMYYLVFEIWRRSCLPVPGKLPPPPLKPPDKPKGKELQEILAAKEPFLKQDLLDADRLTTKMSMLRECARLHEDAEHIGHLAKLLKSQNSEKFEAARRLLGQVREKVYSKDAVHEIKKGVTLQKIQEWRDWGACPAWKRVRSPILVSVWMLLVFLAILCTTWLARRDHFIWLGIVMLLFCAFFGVLASVGDPLTRLANRLDSRRKEQTGGDSSKGFDQIWKVDKENVRIDVGTNEVHVFEPVQLRVKFGNEALNFEDVLEDITPFWHFDHDDLTHEEGWEVVHYFPRERKYNVRVKFQKREGEFLTHHEVATRLSQPSLVVEASETVFVQESPAGKVTQEALELEVVQEPAKPNIVEELPADDHVYAFKEIEAKPLKHEIGAWDFVMDIIWVFVALIPAMAALFTGAIEQLNKVDFMPAMVAIFGLGFASDQVKNLFKKSQ